MLCNYGYLVTGVTITFGPEVNMGILIKMPAPRFEHTPFKTHAGSVILTECKKCGVKRLLSFANGSVDTWEKKHCCGTSNSGNANEKEVG